MKVVGLVVEYNPFHNGHLYHLQQAKASTQAEYVVCIMSGNFLQRGEPALLNKWARSEMALKAGADLVFELPVAFATQSAEGFAQGAIASLDALGIVTHLCFGSEIGQIEELQTLADICSIEDDHLQALHQKHLKTGLSYPSARTNALKEYFSQRKDLKLGQDLENQLIKPNNILGLQYLIALKRLNSQIEPVTLQRVKAEYHDENFNDESIASATAIRQSLATNNQLKAIAPFVPTSTFEILEREFSQGRGPVFPEHLFPFIQMKLRTTPLEELNQALRGYEGLENRLWEKSMTETTWKTYLESVKSKRYTFTRLQRLLFHLTIGYSQENWQTFKKQGPQYLRLLAYSQKGRPLLKEIKQKGSLPLISGMGGFLKQSDQLTKTMLSLDITASNLYTLLYPNKNQALGNLDFSIPPLSVPTP